MIEGVVEVVDGGGGEVEEEEGKEVVGVVVEVVWAEMDDERKRKRKVVVRRAVWEYIVWLVASVVGGERGVEGGWRLPLAGVNGSFWWGVVDGEKSIEEALS